MNVLIVNNRFFISGGPERYLFTVMDQFERHGHRIVPLSIAYAQNQPSPYSLHFLSPPVDETSIYYREFHLSPLKKIQLVGRSIYSLEARRTAAQMAEEYQIQIAYLLIFANYISPSIIHALKSRGVRVVVRLSDFTLLCPAYLFLRDGKPCTECLDYGLSRAVIHRCLQNSVQVSLARALAMQVHRWMRVYDLVDAFVAPSRFVMDMMVRSGFPESKFHHLPSPVKVPEQVPPISAHQDDETILYFGRFSPEKGIESLLLAFQQVQAKRPRARLVLAGAPTPEQERLQVLAQQRRISNIEFAGFAGKDQLTDLLARARFTVCPSICYDNTPMSVYESLAHTRPAIVSRIGSLPEQVRDSVDGLLFEPGNSADLAEKMLTLLGDPALAQRMGEAGRQRVLVENDPEMHYQRLLKLFEQKSV